MSFLVSPWPVAQSRRKGSKQCLVTTLTRPCKTHPDAASQRFWFRALPKPSPRPAKTCQSVLRVRLHQHSPAAPGAQHPCEQGWNPGKGALAPTLSSLRGSALDSSRMISMMLSTCSATAAPPLSLLSCSATRACKGWESSGEHQHKLVPGGSTQGNSSMNWFEVGALRGTPAVTGLRWKQTLEYHLV